LGAEINNIAVRTKFQGGSSQVSVFGSTSLNSAGNPQNASNAVTRSGSISIDTGSGSSTSVAADMVNLAASAGFNTIAKGIEGFRLGNPLNTATTAQATVGATNQFITFESENVTFAAAAVTDEAVTTATQLTIAGATSTLVGKTLFIGAADRNVRVTAVDAGTGVVTLSGGIGAAVGAGDAVTFKGATLSAALSAGDKVFANGVDTGLVIKTGVNYAAGARPFKIEVTGTDVTIAANANIDFFSSANFATAAQVSTIESLIATNSTNRGTLGAAINSLEYAVDNMQTLSTNLADGISRIVDTDYAAETSNLTRTQILQQAATSMLAQANQMPNVILTLLK
jgi:flagellin